MEQQEFRIADRFTVHGYYSLCPYAPDGSGRILAAGCDYRTGRGAVYILDPTGKPSHCFGEQRISASFFHTGFWQSWEPDAQEVYFSAWDGNPLLPRYGVYNLKTGRTSYGEGDLEGVSPGGLPTFYGLHAMLYAAGYGDGDFHPDMSPIPFSNRKAHGLFRTASPSVPAELVLSVEQLLERLPDQERFLEDDRGLSEAGGLTMMVYCVRYSRDGKRLLFHVGNHCVSKTRGEPKMMAIYTANRDLTEIHLALDLSRGKNGVHWSWHPDGQHLVGYGPRPGETGGAICLATVRYDGTGYRMISTHGSGGHPSICPKEERLCVTDEVLEGKGFVTFLDTQNGQVIQRIELPKYNKNLGEIPPGRNRHFVCHHPVFNLDGSKVLCNQLSGENASLVEFDVDAMRRRWGRF